MLVFGCRLMEDGGEVGKRVVLSGGCLGTGEPGGLSAYGGRETTS
jgi:hypothetical protein